MEQPPSDSNDGSKDGLEYQHTPCQVHNGGSSSGVSLHSDWSHSLPNGVREVLSKEPVEVQAAYAYLASRSYALWSNWLITDAWRRVAAARWLAREMKQVEKVMTSNNFQPL